MAVPPQRSWGGVRAADGATVFELGLSMPERIPFLAAGDHDVEDDDQLTHAGDEGDLGGLSFGDQALVVVLENRVAAGGGADDGQEEQVAQLSPATLDEASSAMLAAVVVVGGDPDQGGSGLVCDQAE